MNNTSLNSNILKSASHWHWSEYLFWLIPIAAYFIFPENLSLLSQIAITALFAMSLDLILGYAGMVSLGHAAFFGIGAYVAGFFAKYGIQEPLLGLLGAALIAGTAGFVSSFLVLRGSDLTRIMVTLGVSLMLFELANKFTDLTGGLDGLQGIEMGSVLGSFRFDIFSKTAYVYSVVVTFILFIILRRLVHSPFGLSLKGIHQNALRMPALGTPVNLRLVVIYTISATVAGIAGALLTQTSQFVSVDVFSFSRSAEIMLVLVLGGTGYLYGGILGAAVFMVVHYFLSNMNPQYWQFWLGLVLILIVLFARDGLMGLIKRIHQRFGKNA